MYKDMEKGESLIIYLSQLRIWFCECLYGKWEISGFVFSDQVFQKEFYNLPDMAHLHSALCGGEYNAGVFCSHHEQPAYNLNLVSSTRAEVQVTKGMFFFTEAPQRMKQQVSKVMTHISYLVGNSVLCVFQNSKYSLKNIHHKKEMVSLIPSKPTLTVLKKGDLMESNEPTVGRKILRYSSLQVKGGIG